MGKRRSAQRQEHFGLYARMRLCGRQMGRACHQAGGRFCFESRNDDIPLRSGYFRGMQVLQKREGRNHAFPYPRQPQPHEPQRRAHEHAQNRRRGDAQRTQRADKNRKGLDTRQGRSVSLHTSHDDSHGVQHRRQNVRKFQILHNFKSRRGISYGHQQSRENQGGGQIRARLRRRHGRSQVHRQLCGQLSCHEHSQVGGLRAGFVA